MKAKDVLGRFGEDLATRYLSEAGLAILDRNWRCPDGELDIVARDGDVLAFVEVKTRSTLAYGHPAEAVTPVKAARIHHLAMRWVDERRADRPWLPIRFDVISIVRLTPDGPRLTHLPGAF